MKQMNKQTPDRRSEARGHAEGGGHFQGHFHTWKYWGCAAGLSAYFELPELAQGAFMSFDLLAHELASTADFAGYYQPNSITIF